jgi:hypothetical protein
MKSKCSIICHSAPSTIKDSLSSAAKIIMKRVTFKCLIKVEALGDNTSRLNHKHSSNPCMITTLFSRMNMSSTHSNKNQSSYKEHKTIS